MGEKNNLITICNSRIDGARSAVRVYNMYKNLKKLNCTVKHLQWSPHLRPYPRNILNWFRLLSFKFSSNNNSRLFIENVQSSRNIELLKSLGLPIVLDVRDDYNLYAASMGIKSSPRLIESRHHANIENFNAAYKILVPSESLIEYYLSNYGDKNRNKFVTIMNATDIEHFRVEHLPKENVVGTIGGASIGDGFDILIDALKIVKSKIPVTGIFAHPPKRKFSPETLPYLEKLHDLADEYDYIKFRDNIEYDTNAPDFFSSSSLLVIPRRSTKINNVATPSKLFDSMAAGRPLVVTNLDEQAKIVKKYNCGLVCEPNSKDMADKITILLKDKNLSTKMGENGRKAAVSDHNWQIRAKTIISKAF